MAELGRIAEESARGSFSLIAGTAASTVIGAVFVIIIARLLGPAVDRTGHPSSLPPLIDPPFSL